MARHPFEVLQIPDPDHAIWADVYAAYRRRSKETHPDLGGSAEEFLEVKEAFDTLLLWDAQANHPDTLDADTTLTTVPDPEPATQTVLPPITPRIRGAWRRRRPTDPPAYQPRHAKPDGPRRAAS